MASYFEIVPDGDLTIHLVESESSEPSSDDEDEIDQVQSSSKTLEHPDNEASVTFSVNRSVLIKNSKYFSRLLAGGFKEEKQSTVTLHDDRITAISIWLKCLHDVDLTDIYDVSHHEIWYLVATADKYNFEVKRLKGWFAEWYRHAKLDQIDSNELLFPCWIFDHAKGFQRVTTNLVYNSPKGIYEENPTRLHTLHVRPLIIREF